jgi:hypothetical protein
MRARGNVSTCVYILRCVRCAQNKKKNVKKKGGENENAVSCIGNIDRKAGKVVSGAPFLLWVITPFSLSLSLPPSLPLLS